MEKEKYKELRSGFDFLMGMLWVHEDFKNKMQEPIMDDLMSFINEQLDEQMTWKQ